MRSDFRKKGIALITALAVLVSTFAVLPQTGQYAYAAYGDPAIKIGADVLSRQPNTPNSQTLHFADNTWRVIGYNGEGLASESGTATLLSSVNIKTRVQFNPSIYNSPNKYSGSILKGEIDKTVSGDELNAIKARHLNSGRYSDYSDPRNVDCIAGNAVDAKLWPLSTKEAYSLNRDLFGVVPGDPGTLETYWWLRSPGDDGYKVAVAYGYNYANAGGVHVTNLYGVRPAFLLDFDSVLFTSTAEGGKASGEAGADALTQVGINGGQEWKLTIYRESSFNLDSVTSCDGKVLDIAYSGAATGDNEYISAIVKGSDGSVKYYGRISKVSAATGKVHINIDGKMEGGDTLQVFNEQYNGDKKTDYASELVPVTIPSQSLHDMTETPAKSATAKQAGNIAYWTCSNCDKHFSDAEGTAEVDITKNASDGGVIIPAKGSSVKKKANTLKIKAKNVKLKGKKKKLKKTKTLSVGKLIKFKNKGQGAKTYNLASVKKGKKSFAKYFAINKRNGKLTVKKGLKRGTYKVKIKVKAAGNSKYNASAWKTVTCKVRVK